MRVLSDRGRAHGRWAGRGLSRLLAGRGAGHRHQPVRRRRLDGPASGTRGGLGDSCVPGERARDCRRRPSRRRRVVHCRARVRVAFSDDSGATFGPPVRIDDGTPAGRVDIALLPGAGALATWLERTGDGAEVRVRRVRSGGSTGPSLMITTSTAERVSGFSARGTLGRRRRLRVDAAGVPADGARGPRQGCRARRGDGRVRRACSRAARTRTSCG